MILSGYLCQNPFSVSTSGLGALDFQK